MPVRRRTPGRGVSSLQVGLKAEIAAIWADVASEYMENILVFVEEELRGEAEGLLETFDIPEDLYEEATELLVEKVLDYYRNLFDRARRNLR